MLRSAAPGGAVAAAGMSGNVATVPAGPITGGLAQPLVVGIQVDFGQPLLVVQVEDPDQFGHHVILAQRNRERRRRSWPFLPFATVRRPGAIAGSDSSLPGVRLCRLRSCGSRALPVGAGLPAEFLECVRPRRRAQPPGSPATSAGIGRLVPEIAENLGDIRTKLFVLQHGDERFYGLLVCDLYRWRIITARRTFDSLWCR